MPATYKYVSKDGLTYFKGKCDDEYQAKLVSGTNIKTINNQSILGSGNLAISGGTTRLYRHEIRIQAQTGGSSYCYIEGVVYSTSASVPQNVSGALNLLFPRGGDASNGTPYTNPISLFWVNQGAVTGVCHLLSYKTQITSNYLHFTYDLNNIQASGAIDAGSNYAMLLKYYNDISISQLNYFEDDVTEV